MRGKNILLVIIGLALLVGPFLLLVLKWRSNQMNTLSPNVGYFNTTARGDKLDGTFLLRLTQCKNVVSGKNTSGLPPFPVRGNFKGLPSGTVKEELEKRK